MNHEFVPDSSTVFTPQELASAMVRAVGDAGNCAWLDPCVGDGAFVAEMSAIGVPRERIQALDIAPTPSQRDGLACTKRPIDFIEWASHNACSVDRVVMNPPYVALSRVRGTPLRNALAVSFADGRRLPLKANYWCAFVLRAIECLRPGGALVAVLPAAWDFARYAIRVRDAVAKSFGDISIIRCASPLFPTVKEGVVVIVGTRRGDQPTTMRRVEVPDLAGTLRALEELAVGKAPRDSTVVRNFSSGESPQARLDELIDIRIGAVTGDATYFLLSEAERAELGLPRRAVRPVLSRSKHLTTAVLDDSAWARIRDAGGRIWLFRPTQAALKHPAVKKYLRRGKQGECNTDAYKISSRKPWHCTPLPNRVDGFLSGMSKRFPFLVLCEMKHLTATNTLYIVSFKRGTQRIDKAALGIVLLTSRVRREFARHSRVYADGLLKFEPSELGNIRVPVVRPQGDAVDVFRRATELLLQGKEAAAEAVADAWVDACCARATDSLPMTPVDEQVAYR